MKKILIANRGEIACRIARTAKRLGYETVAVYSDADAEALHVSACDEAVRIGEAAVTKSYLNMAAVIEAAKTTGADAIHPGYGLLSEKSDFARAVVDAGLTFIGPSAETLAKLGDKVAARRIAQEAEVAILPGSGDAVSTAAEASAVADAIGYPVLLKAAMGGGGIGMTVAHDDDEVERALTASQGRGQQAFGDARVFVEKYIERPRHVEVQLMADREGEIVALGERECSIQRRHQKIIEESPAPALLGLRYPNYTREAMFEAAIRIAKACGYVNAGTCEFILDARGKFYFLEVNARLQVEHPVTEMCTNLDLVEWQLRIAEGEPLSDAVRHCEPSGHAIEARLCAEDPEKNFMPNPGRIETCHFPEGPAGKVRVDAGVHAGSEVSHHYDSLLAKVCVYESGRHKALLLLDRMLSATRIGPIKTNTAFLRKVIDHSAFLAGQYDTGFVERLLKPST